MSHHATDHETLWDLIKDIKFGMLTHRHANGMLHAHPLTTQNRKLDEGSTLYFFISRKSELARAGGEGVEVDDDGRMSFVPDHCREGDFVDLRFEMNTLVVLSTCQHRIDPNPHYEPTAVELLCWRSGTAGKDDPCRLSMPENGRGFINTERYYL